MLNNSVRSCQIVACGSGPVLLEAKENEIHGQRRRGGPGESQYSQEEVPRGKGAESQFSLGPGPGKRESITGCGRNDGPWLSISFPSVSFFRTVFDFQKNCKESSSSSLPALVIFFVTNTLH